MLKTIKILFILGLLGALSAAAITYGIYQSVKDKIPTVEELREIELQVPLRIYTADHKLIGEFGEKRRTPISYDEIPPLLEAAILSAEDTNFYHHPGVDVFGLGRAVLQLITTGEKQGGGSTITMQVARNYFLSFEQTFTRKFTEIFISLKMEQELSKQEILELYMNKIYLGKRAYGFQAAAQVYYDKRLDELNLAQLAMIAGLPKAPSRYNPIANPSRALIRRNWILQRMLTLGKIDKDSYQEAVESPITALNYGIRSDIEANYVAEMVRSDLYKTFGDALYEAGLSVYTTIDSRKQIAANKAIENGLAEYDERHGYRGAVVTRTDLIDATQEEQLDALSDIPTVGQWTPALVLKLEDQSALIRLPSGERHTLPWEALSWARPYIDHSRRGSAPKKANDIVVEGDILYVKPDPELTWKLSQIPEVQSALVSLNSHNGQIEALVGGLNFFQNKFNRVTQSKRQPGSSFKPFIYTSALTQGYSAASIINDAPVVFNDPNLATAWRPTNDGGKFYGPTRLRQALYRSQNIVSVRLLDEMGVRPTLTFLKRFGFDPNELPNNLSLSLGSANVSPMQIAKGYAVLSNGGYQIEPYLIDRVEGREGEELYQAKPTTVCTDCTLVEVSIDDLLASEQSQESNAQEANAQADKSQHQVDNRQMGVFESADGDKILPIAPLVIDPEVNYIIYDMMRDVIKYGTGRRARVLKRDDIAGKTGTTNDGRDAWFSGFNGDTVTTVWSGFDNSSELGRGEWGGSVSLPTWIDYMRVALDGTQPSYIKKPSSLITVRIDPTTGERALPGQKNAIFEIFRKQNVPAFRTSPSPTSDDKNGANTSNKHQDTVLEDLF
ncbi:penicillin-binding protein 1A [Marinomonas algicola]|uniref:penicillin-binding protein 1A n=1 Tax=Marinomonas algicola TaxID=2773454 RepID=UPI001749C12D|nr:penicillin-binding protein 1A [Marinomonas algicola]